MRKHKKFYTLQEIKDELFKTKAEKEEYAKSYKAFEIENDRQVLLDLARQLRKARQNAGITQEELAKKMKTNKGNISRMEHGKQNLTMTLLAH